LQGRFRTAIAVVLASLMGAPPVSISAPMGSIEGTVTIGGRPLSGVTVSLIQIESGKVYTAKSSGGGAYQLQVVPGDYILTTDGRAGFAVGKAPAKVSVPAGAKASADIELVSLAMASPVRVARLQDPQQPVPDVGQYPPLPPAQPESVTPPKNGGPQNLSDTTPQPDTTPAQDITAPSGPASPIQHDPVGCFIAGQFPLLDASFTPPDKVARARVYFKASTSNDWFFIEMAPDPTEGAEAGKFLGKLPRPKLEASPVSYYIQMTNTDFVDSQTNENSAIVVADEKDCPHDRKVAAIGPSGPVQVFSAATGAAVSAVGFAAGGIALTAGAIALIVGAAAVGVGVAVGGGPTPTPKPPTPPPTPKPSPTAKPTPKPTPTPTPVPTAVPSKPPISPTS